MRALTDWDKGYLAGMNLCRNDRKSGFGCGLIGSGGLWLVHALADPGWSAWVVSATMLAGGALVLLAIVMRERR